MKSKFLHILFGSFVLILFNCSQQEDTNFDPNDWDSDGVSNEKEYFDNTNPNDPCSLITSSQYPPNIPESWKKLDCDGDGVTNGQEIIDNTSIFNICDYVDLNQDLGLVSEEWKNYDCDEDGVTNNKEILDNTNPDDNCDFIVSSISLPLKEYWLKLDCDNDGRTNEDEINETTNPTNSNDFKGKGNKLDYIKIKGSYFYQFEKEGQFLKKIEHLSDGVLTNFTYDNQNRLIEVFHLKDGIRINFSYTNDIISEIKRYENNQELIYEISFDYSNNTYSKKLKNSNSDITYYSFNSNHRIKKIKSNSYEENFEYDLKGNILNSKYTTSNSYSGSFSYSSKENVKNPLKIAYDNIYLQYVLIEEILKNSFYIKFGAFNSDYLLQMYRNSPPTSHAFSYGIKNIQDNKYPTLGYYSDFSINYDIYYYYTE